MNDEETRHWLTHHRRLHSDFAAWMRTLSVDEADDFISATAACLRLVASDKAARISQKMFEGSIKKPYAFSDHPRIVRENGEDAYALGGSSQRAIGEMEELKKQARENPAGPVLPLLRDLYEKIGIVPSDKRPPQCGPMSRASSRIGKCRYCEGQAIIINDVGHCLDCGVRFDPVGAGMLPHDEAMVAKSAGEQRREKKKKYSKSKKR